MYQAQKIVSLYGFLLVNYSNGKTKTNNELTVLCMPLLNPKSKSKKV